MKKNLQKVLCLFLPAIICFFSSLSVISDIALAEDGITNFANMNPVSSTLNPVGAGARAVGMGSAFIGVADDATAASWNPAGLIQLEQPELAVVYSYLSNGHNYSSVSYPEINSADLVNTSALNHASITYPFVLFNRNMIISLGYQRLYELGKKIKSDYPFFYDGQKLNSHLETVQKGQLYALSPAFAVQVNPKLYLGATLNLWKSWLGRNGGKYRLDLTPEASFLGIPVTFNIRQNVAFSFSGTNVNLGFLWQFHEHFTLGGVYKTAFDAHSTLHSVTNIADNLGGSLISPYFQEAEETLTMKMPASYGLGLAYRHDDKWTVAFDIYRTGWSRFSFIDSLGAERNPETFMPLSEGKLKDTTQIRLGTEYLLIRQKYVVPLRFGVFYDPEPATNNTSPFYGFSLGAGYAEGKVVFDAAYQFRFSRKTRGDLWEVPDSKSDINQHTVMMSVIYYF